MGNTFAPGSRSEQRFEEFQRVARGMNWALTGDPHSIGKELAEVIPIIRRDFHGIDSVMQGRIAETEVKILDVWVRARVRQGVLFPWMRVVRTAVYIRSDKLKLPPFTIRHNPGWTKLNMGTNFPRGGNGVVTFSQFYKNYSIAVQGSTNDFFIDPQDNARVRGFLTPSIQSFYEERNGVGTFCQGKHFVFFTTSHIVEPKHIPVFLNDALEAFELWKAASRLSPIPEQILNRWLKVTERRQALRPTIIFGGCLMVMIPMIAATAVVIAPAIVEFVNPASSEIVNQYAPIVFLVALLLWIITQTISVVVYHRYMKRKLEAG